MHLAFDLQAVNKMEARQRTNNMPKSVTMETENDVTPTSNTERNTDDEEEGDEEGSEGEQSPTMHQDTLPSHGLHSEDEVESASDGPEGVGPSEEEDCGTCRPEPLLQETVARLKAAMETDKWRERQTGEPETWRNINH